MTNIYRLRPDNLPTEIIACLNALCVQAKLGKVSGIAFVAFVEDYGFVANAAGRAFEDPTHTRGMLLALDDKLAAHESEGGGL